ncbi:cysteine hydrolase family protein [Telmatospirillum siberiense]|uniref:Cysteine hydrolase n=1 Tax=Telmatospirillum siberiense TaxID=382514 RepID=A0A2N3PVH5_9PROT|nr:isochorismatase family cysteine hydrolase [Telmatospirillum siberiense]PKU24399.1 cysteine hydrolase [Telmatospirillum siberiense]
MPIIAARPYDFTFPAHGLGLIVIDMQRDFLEPGGFGEALGNDVGHLAAAIGPTARLLAAFRARGLPVIHTREAHSPDLSDCPPAKLRRGRGALHIGDPGPMGRILIDGEEGSAIVSELAPLPGEKVVRKPGKGAFHATALGQLLPQLGISHLIFAGVTTEVCVQTTMREANDRGYECLLAEDATASYFPAFKRATIDMLVAQDGIVGWAASVQAIETALGEL